MKCDDVQHWLLSAKSNAPSPAAVLRHQQGCRKCRRLGRRLRRLDDKVRRLPLPPASPQAKNQLLQQLEPRQQAPPPPRAPQPHRWHRPAKRILAAAAAILLFVGGWYLGRLPFASDTRPPRLSATANKKNQDLHEIIKEPAILLQTVRHDIQLAQTSEPATQLAVLSDLMEDLLAETLHRLRQGSLNEIPELTTLYQNVVENGVMARAAVLAPEKKPAVFPAIVDKLQSAQNTVKKITAASLPVVADLLEPVAVTSRQASERLRGDRPFGKVTSSDLPQLPSSTLAKLVYQGLKLADEENPLRRAELCSQLTPSISRRIVVLAANGDADQAFLLGESLSALIHKGIEHNLKRAKDAGDRDTQREEEVRKRVNFAVKSLEKNMTFAAPAARSGMKRALDAVQVTRSGKGDEKAKAKKQNAEQKHQAKKSTRRKPDNEKKKTSKNRNKKKPFVPPGLLKRRLNKGAGRLRKNAGRRKFSYLSNTFPHRSTHVSINPKPEKMAHWAFGDRRRDAHGLSRRPFSAGQGKG